MKVQKIQKKGTKMPAAVEYIHTTARPSKKGMSQISVCRSKTLSKSEDNFSFLNKVNINDNRQKLNKIERLKRNWNGYGAKAFTKGVIKKVNKMLDKIIVQPKIFPTPNNSIQFEYYDRKDLSKYLEFDVSYHKILCNDKPIVSKEINAKIRQFYGIDR